MDIGVYTTAEVLEHKKRDGMVSDGKCCYWHFYVLPKGFANGDDFYFAADGKWRGYFSDCWIGEEDGYPCVFFHSEHWHELPEHLRTTREPFQGYTKNVPPREKTEEVER